MAKINIKKLEADLWESADLLRAESKTYVQPILYAGVGIDILALCF